MSIATVSERNEHSKLITPRDLAASRTQALQLKGDGWEVTIGNGFVIIGDTDGGECRFGNDEFIDMLDQLNKEHTTCAVGDLS